MLKQRNSKTICLLSSCFLKDPFREARLIADDSVRRALDSIDYTSDPTLNVPDKYKHMIWFTLPIDVALMMVKQNEIGQEISCDINSIPFMPVEARVNFEDYKSINRIISFFF